MSRIVSSDISFNFVISPRDLIDGLLSEEWDFEVDGKAMYLPFGDQGDFDWQISETITLDLHNLIEKKVQAKEVVGLKLKNRLNGTFVTFLYEVKDSKLSLIVDDSVDINSSQDFDWLIDSVKNVFGKLNFSGEIVSTIANSDGTVSLSRKDNC